MKALILALVFISPLAMAGRAGCTTPELTGIWEAIMHSPHGEYAVCTFVTAPNGKLNPRFSECADGSVPSGQFSISNNCLLTVSYTVNGMYQENLIILNRTRDFGVGIVSDGNTALGIIGIAKQ